MPAKSTVTRSRYLLGIVSFLVVLSCKSNREFAANLSGVLMAEPFVASSSVTTESVKPGYLLTWVTDVGDAYAVVSGQALRYWPRVLTIQYPPIVGTHSVHPNTELGTSSVFLGRYSAGIDPPLRLHTAVSGTITVLHLTQETVTLVVHLEFPGDEPINGRLHSRRRRLAAKSVYNPSRKRK